MRLSEAYLTRAEAKFRLGEDATEDINTLRRRANCTRLVQTVTEKRLLTNGHVSSIWKDAVVRT